MQTRLQTKLDLCLSPLQKSVAILYLTFRNSTVQHEYRTLDLHLPECLLNFIGAGTVGKVGDENLQQAQSRDGVPAGSCRSKVTHTVTQITFYTKFMAFCMMYLCILFVHLILVCASYFYCTVCLSGCLAVFYSVLWTLSEIK